MGTDWQDFQVPAAWDDSSGVVPWLLPDPHQIQQIHPTPKAAKA